MWLPNARVEVVRVALPELRAACPITVDDPSMKVICPVGVPLPVAGATVAVSVRVEPKTGVPEMASVVVVAARLDTTVVVSASTLPASTFPAPSVAML